MKTLLVLASMISGFSFSIGAVVKTKKVEMQSVLSKSVENCYGGISIDMKGNFHDEMICMEE